MSEKKLKDRIGAVILKDKKLLLVTGYECAVYWTPGGKPVEGESHEEALKREVLEELDVQINGEIKRYGDWQDRKEDGVFSDMQNHYYLVEGYEGEIKPMAEITKVKWFSKEDFLSGKFRATSGSREFLIPKLIEDGLL